MDSSLYWFLFKLNLYFVYYPTLIILTILDRISYRVFKKHIKGFDV